MILSFYWILNDMDDIYTNNEEYNPNKECKILVGFDDMRWYDCWYASQ